MEVAELDSPSTERPAGGLLARIRRGRGAWALADQVLISGTNFLTTVLVARGLGLEGFGEFSNVYNGLLFANVLQASLVTQPHNVLGASRHGHDPEGYVRYTTAAAAGQALLATCEGVLALGLAAYGWIYHWHAAALLALVPAIVAWQLQEFVRRVLYSEGRTTAAFINDVISYGGQMLWIAAYWWLDRLRPVGAPPRLTTACALYVLAATSGAAVLLGLWQLKNSLRGRASLSAWMENWTFGKWLLGSEVLTWCASLQMYMFLAGALFGNAASGQLRAAQTLFGPARVISFFLATVLPIQFARSLRAGGLAALDRQLKTVASQVLPILGSFCLLVAIFARPALKLVYDNRYAGASGVLVLYALFAFSTYVQMFLSAALSARRQTRTIFMGSVCGAIIACAVAYPLVRRLNVSGAVVGMILTSVVVTTLYWRAYRQGAAEAEGTPEPAASQDQAKVEPVAA